MNHCVQPPPISYISIQHIPALFSLQERTLDKERIVWGVRTKGMTTNLLSYEHLCLTSPWHIRNGPKFGQLRWRNRINFRPAETCLLGDHKGGGVPILSHCLKLFQRPKESYKFTSRTLRGSIRNLAPWISPVPIPTNLEILPGVQPRTTKRRCNLEGEETSHSCTGMDEVGVLNP